jgi:hypothetical protein
VFRSSPGCCNICKICGMLENPSTYEQRDFVSPKLSFLSPLAPVLLLGDSTGRTAREISGG